MDKLDALHNVWKVHSDILSKRGVDLPQVLQQWTARQVEQLTSPGARSDFKELCANGCVPEILAPLVAFLRWSPKLEDFWTKIYGNPNDRRRVRKSLEKTAKAIEGLFAFSISLEDEEFVSQAAKFGRIAPARLASELKLYASVLELCDRIPRETQTRSLADFGKFSLTDYVKQVTGRFHDRNVSALIAETIGPADYNEVAHRMWRARNFKRMSEHFEKLSDLLSAAHALAVDGSVTNSHKNN
jgi:hypothetical protein